MSLTLNWFKAKFASVCDSCGDKILAGDWASYNADKHMLCQACGREAEEDGE